MKAFLDAAALIAEAESHVGHGLMDSALRSRIVAVVGRLNGDAGIDADAIAKASVQVRELIETRLEFEKVWRENPEIAEEVVADPIFVVGFSRTGTSAMQALLAQDSANRAVTWAMSCFPTPAPGQNLDDDLERAKMANRVMERWIDTAKGILTAHPYWDEGARAFVENEELFALDFWWVYPTKYFDVPSTPDTSDLFDARAAFAFHKRLLQYWQWRSPARRWVTKGVAHQFVLDALWETYPDARCVWTHRNPATMIVASLGIISICNEGICGDLDRHAFGADFTERAYASIGHMLSQSWANDPRAWHVRFAEFMTDQVGTVAAIYEGLGLAWTPEFEAAMRAWIADPANRSDRHGKFNYRAEDFGLEARNLAERFSDYSERFLSA